MSILLLPHYRIVKLSDMVIKFNYDFFADIVAAAVLSGNRNFEGRVHALTRANYLASPPLVVAYALAGTVSKKKPNCFNFFFLVVCFEISIASVNR